MAGTGTGAALNSLEDLQTRYPELAADITDLANLYQRKLWHQLTVKLQECFEKPGFNRDDIPIRLYEKFILDFGQKINLLKLAQFAVHASKFQQDHQWSIDTFQRAIKSLQDMKLPAADQPIVFLKTHVAQEQLALQRPQEAKALLEEAKEQLGQLTDVDPSVSASVYYVSSQYNKGKQDYAEFYKDSLLYLSYVSSDALDYQFKLQLAVDIALAALLGENLYNYAQLLMHPIITVLDGSSYAWLRELLECFNDGDLATYNELCVKHAAVLNAQPGLVANERRLREKVTISVLMALVWSLPAEERTIPLSAIAARTKLDTDGVEFLLMKALALHLLEGSINQVRSVVEVQWVQPRVLTKPQIQGLKDRLDGWISKVGAARLSLEQETVGVTGV